MWIDLVDVAMFFFVYIPAALFYLLIGCYVWSRRGEKKHKERHEDDGK